MKGRPSAGLVSMVFLHFLHGLATGQKKISAGWHLSGLAAAFTADKCNFRPMSIYTADSARPGLSSA